MTAVFCHNAGDRKAEAWEARLTPFGHLEFAVSDAAKGVAKAVTRRIEARRDDPSGPTLEHGPDVFHTAREAHRITARHWRRAEAAWERAEAADVRVADAKRHGVDARGVAQAARAAWGKATASLAQAERLESAWGRAAAALDLCGLDGRLNDRSRAESEVAAAREDLVGPDWAKVGNFLKGRRSLAFLDRMHRRLESVEPRREWREAMARRWWLRHRRPPASAPVTELVRAVGRDRALSEEERAPYDRVAAVLRDTFRASSAVECMNRVLRMQRSRHRRMTQPMLDLKRLYRNCRKFRTGPRKDTCPYRALGRELPTFNDWALLQTDPAQLAQQLSTQGNAA